jgi:DNA modification methylase
MKSDVTLLNGDCRKMLSLVESESVDVVVTDPPYEIGFNGNKWDSTGVAYDKTMWADVLRAQKPGSYLLAFGGTRTYHRMGCAIEDAGYVVDDCLAWLYGNGFPKHRSKLKPAWEPVVLARKPAAKATPLNIDENRDNGRWPANVLLDETAASQLDQAHLGREPLSRLFYVAKATTGEREAGLSRKDGFRRRKINLLEGINGGTPTKPRFNDHPTVKPIDLMRRLIRLATPENGVVLDPFTGSGTTGCAAVMEERSFVGIERERSYFRVADARIRHWKEQARA